MRRPLARKTAHRIGSEMRDILAMRFPFCFVSNGKLKMPLKIHILGDLFRVCRSEFSKRKLHAAIQDYCSGPNYWGALAAGGYRIDLDGKVYSVVSQEHRLEALKNFNRCPDYLRERFWRLEIDELDNTIENEGQKQTPAESLLSPG